MLPLLVNLALVPVTLSAQTVSFHFTNGTEQSYALSDIRRLTFVGDEQVLLLNEGTQYTWNVSSIGRYEFDETIGIVNVASGFAPLQLKVYPNPATAEVSLDTELPLAGRLEVDILDLKGRMVRELYAGERPSGALRLQWDAADDSGARVSPGTYLVRLDTPYGSSIKPVVIQ